MIEASSHFSQIIHLYVDGITLVPDTHLEVSISIAGLEV